MFNQSRFNQPRQRHNNRAFFFNQHNQQPMSMNHEMMPRNQEAFINQGQPHSIIAQPVIHEPQMFSPSMQPMMNQTPNHLMQPQNRQLPPSNDFAPVEQKKKGIGGLMSNLLNKNKSSKNQQVQPMMNGPFQARPNNSMQSTGNNGMMQSSSSNYPNTSEPMMMPKSMKESKNVKRSSGLSTLKNMFTGNSEDRSSGSAPSITSILMNPSSLQEIMGNINNIAGATGKLMPVVNDYLPMLKKIPNLVSGFGQKDETDNQKDAVPTKVNVTKSNTMITPKRKVAPKPAPKKQHPLPSVPKLYTHTHTQSKK